MRHGDQKIKQTHLPPIFYPLYPPLGIYKAAVISAITAGTIIILILLGVI